LVKNRRALDVLIGYSVEHLLSSQIAGNVAFERLYMQHWR